MTWAYSNASPSEKRARFQSLLVGVQGGNPSTDNDQLFCTHRHSGRTTFCIPPSIVWILHGLCVISRKTSFEGLQALLGFLMPLCKTPLLGVRYGHACF